MKILGISCYYHDAAAALIDNEVVVAAAEEERFSRKKHDSAFPKHAIAFCLKQANISAPQLDYVVFYEKPFRKFQRIINSILATYPKTYKVFREAMITWLTQKLWVKQEITTHLNINPSKILFSEHHLSHAASCFYPSPFHEAAFLTVDGVGEWTTTTYGVGYGNEITILKEIHYPQSLGLLYSAFTAFLGFEVNEGEWKVMGLAPYGKPKYTEKIWKIVTPRSDGSFFLDMSYFSFHHSDSTTYSPKFTELFGTPIPPRESHRITPFAANMAASIQIVTEELLLNMARAVKKQTHMENLCIAGGVALNSVANYRILRESGFKNIFVQPAAGDSGGAMGAALYTYHHALGKNARAKWIHAYLGESYGIAEIEVFLKKNRLTYKKFTHEKLVDYISERIREGKVIGWMQGRFEWGPRALGNRSILADPRNPNMKDIINSKVKFREAFRPFAPSVLAEHAHLPFDLPHDPEKHQPLEFMLYVVPVRKEWRKKVPAINHADNTARPQLVYKNTNPLYHALISKFYQKTGVPLVLNTSFNLKGEPIVNTPEDAYSTFSRSGIDILAMGNFVLEK